MRVTAFGGGGFANSYLLEDGKAGEALAIDPGFEAESMILRIAGRLRLTAILNTHGHFDHVSGNRALRDATGAPVMMHRADARLAGKASRLASLVGRDAEDSPTPDRYLEDGDELRVGGYLLRVLHTPGHTPGGISIRGEGVVFCGDLIVGGAPGRTVLPGCSEPALRESIRTRILTLPDPFLLYPGHGPALKIGALRCDPRFGDLPNAISSGDIPGGSR